MRKKRNLILILCLSIVTFILSSCGVKSEHKGTALEPVDKLVRILYFNEGKYKDYKEMFTKPENAFTEEQFNEFRKNPDKSSFKYGAASPEEVIKHMKAGIESSNLVTVYYLEDPVKTKETDAAMQWKVENKDGKWLLKND